MRDMLEARLSGLKREFEIGDKRLRDLEAESSRLRETLLRISGAIQVLDEILASTTLDSTNGVGTDEPRPSPAPAGASESH